MVARKRWRSRRSRSRRREACATRGSINQPGTGPSAGHSVHIAPIQPLCARCRGLEQKGGEGGEGGGGKTHYCCYCCTCFTTSSTPPFHLSDVKRWVRRQGQKGSIAFYFFFVCVSMKRGRRELRGGDNASWLMNNEWFVETMYRSRAWILLANYGLH